MRITAPLLFTANLNRLAPVTIKHIKATSLPYDTVAFGQIDIIEQRKKRFDNYNPQIKDFGTYKIPVHNDKIANLLKDFYTKEEFRSLFNLAENNGTFDFNINKKTGYVQTSLIDPKENPLMSKLVWVTDSCNLMPLLKDKYPEIRIPLMENMSKYYVGQQRAFDKIINNPLLFELNKDFAGTAKNGVGHVFNPQSGVSHKWFARTRLDSMGLYINAVCDLIKAGFEGKEYGYKSSKDISKDTVEAMANSVKYLQKIIYPYAKDTGAWEEQTFNATTSSDVAIINEGFRKIIDLMYAPTDNKELLTIRKRLLGAKHGDVFKDEESMKNMLQIGEYRIKTNSLEEVPNERELDGAMSFIFKTEKFSDDVIEDVKETFKRLKMLEKGTKTSKEIVRNNGAIRYNGDKYLYLNSDIGLAKAEYRPNRKFPPKSEAQWFMVSDMSTAYGIAAKKLLDKIDNDGKITKETAKLLSYALIKQTEYLNRAYARITGENSYKANAKECPAFQIPEAYQSVTDSNGNLKFVPGTHTPLAWAQVSLYEASKQYMENLERI